MRHYTCCQMVYILIMEISCNRSKQLYDNTGNVSYVINCEKVVNVVDYERRVNGCIQEIMENIRCQLHLEGDLNQSGEGVGQGWQIFMAKYTRSAHLWSSLSFIHGRHLSPHGRFFFP